MTEKCAYCENEMDQSCIFGICLAYICEYYCPNNDF